ncbi:ComEC/Rec2 family competence protein [Roseibium sediminicola]|uniref:ComEC family competence protein n=1 Tax=Roseibium sediminicola TaxID=2933272 RepID=A0ABT0GPB5_9HYPH|nr:ComEC family competence protein [Roseibium sp. CAU 1639]
MAIGSQPRPHDDSRLETATLDATQTVIPDHGRVHGTGRPASLVAALLFRALDTGAEVSTATRFWEEQGLLWCAFAFAAGIALYAILPDEPSRFVVALLLAGAGLTAFAALRRRVPGWRTALFLAFLAGLAAGAVRTLSVDAPRLAEPMTVSLSGRVLERQADPNHVRLVLAVETVDNRHVAAPDFPEKIRIRVPKDSAGQVGERIRLSGRLFPPPGPVHPGGYDYSFRAYFDRIGATGFSFGPAERLGPVGGSPGLHAAALVAQLRTGLAESIRESLRDGPEEALIVAVLVGDRSGISETQEEVLRAAGLAHILAISGLHMALFAGGAYGGVLLLLALIPSLALRWPTQKWAALVALAAATIYLLLSGAGLATQRSFLMIALVFLGILIGRRGLTLRSVALAGLALLILAPERLFHPGFQMSFAAVICLVAVYDLWRRRERGLETRPEGRGLAATALAFVGRWGAGLLVTALVAGLATGIIGAYHFGRVAPFGVIGNMLGMPVFSLLVMPMGVLALALMPFGFAALPLSLMSLGVSVLLKIAEFTAGLDAGAGMLGKLEGSAALLLTSALFIGLLLPGRARLIAFLPLMTGAVIAGVSRPPDIQIPAAGLRLAARDASGSLHFSGRGNSFLNDLWYQVEGVPKSAIGSRKMTSLQRRCDRDGCVITSYPRVSERGGLTGPLSPLTIAAPKDLEALEFDCKYADIIVTDLIVRGRCGGALILDQEIRSGRGAVSVWLTVRPSGAGPPDKAALAVPSPQSLPAAPGTKPVIEHLKYAIPDPPRPWHRPGRVTRQTLRRAIRGDSP